MPNPFAEERIERYVYPAPLDPENPLDDMRIDDDVMDESEDERPWCRIRVPNSKGLNDDIAQLTQAIVTTALGGNGNGGAAFHQSTEQRIAQGNRGVFGLLIVEWSFSKDPTESDFGRLNIAMGAWVSACLSDAMEKGTRVEKKPRRTSGKPASGRKGSARRDSESD
jgi:hypothetical protein